VLALALEELNAQNTELTPHQQTEYQKITLQMQHVLQKWPEALGRKAAREMHSRLNLWKAYINDLLDQADHADTYAYEVRHRVIFEKNRVFAARQSETEDMLQVIRPIDSALRSIFEETDFIWNTRLQAAYPQDSYWFLYGVPALRETD
jgi:hypothetical protein